MVSDELILGLVKERISNDDCKNGYLFDGFPRTIAQANGMASSAIDVDYVVEIKVDDGHIIKRMSGRRVHMASGRTYHLEFNPPRIEGKDNETGEELVQRDDDQEETVNKRLHVYHEQTSPLIKYYTELSSQNGSNTKYVSVNGMQDVNDLMNDIMSQLK